MRRTILLLSDARSGSTWVGELISYQLHRTHDISLFDITKEHFSRIDYRSSAEDVCSIFDGLYLDPSGLAASKIFCSSLSVACMLGQSRPDLLNRFFGPQTLWLMVRRRHRIAQAVSLAHAWTSGTFHTYERTPAPQLNVPIETIERALKAIALSDTYLEAAKSRIEPSRLMEVFYEDVQADHVGFLESVIDFLNLRIPEEGRAAYADLSQLSPIGRSEKAEDVSRFSEWLTRNYHYAPINGETDPTDSYTSSHL